MLSKSHNFPARNLARILFLPISHHFPAPNRVKRELSSATRAALYSSAFPAEPIERYTTGGYHPVHIEDTFKDGQYIVLDKLGWGSYSTVWLARDVFHQRYVALKIACASTDGAQSRESGILSRLAKIVPAPSTVIPLLDRFQINGPNGIHNVFVLEPAGPSISAFVRDNGFWTADIARDISCQILRGLACLHEAGIAHGDMHTGNVLISLPHSVRSFSEGEFLAATLKPRKYAVFNISDKRAPLPPGLPEYLVGPVSLGKFFHTPGKPIHVKLADMGESFVYNDSTEEKPVALKTPLNLRAPELLLGRSFDNTVDIWAAACSVISHPPFFAIILAPAISLKSSAASQDSSGTIYELVFGEPPFNGYTHGMENGLLDEIYQFIGMPAEMYSHWSGASEFYDENRNPRLNADLHPSFDERLQESHGWVIQYQGYKDEFPWEQAQLLGSLLKSMMRYQPQERPSARQLLQHPWFAGCSPC